MVYLKTRFPLSREPSSIILVVSHSTPGNPPEEDPKAKTGKNKNPEVRWSCRKLRSIIFRVFIERS
jgi:hypothetical protein